VTLGRVLRFQVDFTAPSGFFSRDTVEVYCGTPTVILSDDASNGIGKWNTTHNTWGVEADDCYRPGAFFADSPTGNQTYAKNCDATMTTVPPLDLSKGVHAYLLFRARWEFETDLDCGTVEANVGSGNVWTPLPGTSTSLGTNSTGSKQPVGQPVYDGARRLWRQERVDLSSFAGPGATSIKVRFRVLSASNPVFDGFRLDDIQVLTFDPLAQPAPVAVGDAPIPHSLALAPPSPNPARGHANLDFALPRGARVRLEVLDLQGRRVRSLVDHALPAGRFAFGWDLRDEDGRAVAPGVYMIRLATGERSLVRPIVVLK
jgi:hypothetical protein